MEKGNSHIKIDHYKLVNVKHYNCHSIKHYHILP